MEPRLVIRALKHVIPRMVAFLVAFRVAGAMHQAGDDFIALTIVTVINVWYFRWCLSAKLPAGQSR